MPLLSFIADDVLENAVTSILEAARMAQVKATQDINRNVVDPFAVLFQMAGFQLDAATWEANEKIRQAEKTLQNSIGTFHQTILGSLKGWKNLEKNNIIDLENPEKRIIAEIKNKYNTLSGGKLSTLYNDLHEQVMPKHSHYKGYTAYYVTVIPDKPERRERPFTPSDKNLGKKCPINDLIREIDGTSFYDLATGEVNSLQRLFDVLPTVIANKTGYRFDDPSFIQAFFRQAFGEAVSLS